VEESNKRPIDIKDGQKKVETELEKKIVEYNK
jgi:hypothetical protein